MSYNTPVRTLQQGSVLQIASGGTLLVDSGGSIQNNGALAADTASFSTITLGGTVGRWAFGTAALASGTAQIYTGLGAVRSAAAFAISGASEGTGAGTATSFQFNWSRAANGTIYALGVAGTLPFAGAGTIAWSAFGV